MPAPPAPATSASSAAGPDPDPDALLARAVEAHRGGALAEARAGYEAVLARRPGDFDATHLLGAVVRLQGEPSLAAALLRRAIGLRPDVAAAHNHLGLALRDLGRPEEAIAAFRDALAHDPAHAGTLNNLGATLRDRGDPAAALACLDRALAAGGEQAAARLNRANALRDLGRTEAALADCDRAVAIAPHLPDAWRVRGIVLRALGLAEAAIASHDAALALRPDDPQALVARGLALADLHRLDEATRSIDAALAVAPHDDDALWALARVRLAAGDFGRGLDAFESRWRIAQGRPFARAFDRPPWDGSTPLDGRTVLLHAEQGLGDTIQFVRYAPLVRARGARVVLEVQPALARLLAHQGLADEVVARGAPLPAFDAHCPLMSLPRAFGTRLDTVPAPVRYLRADPARVAAWTERLGARTRPRIGLVWSGAPTRPGVAERSVPLDAFVALLDEAFDWIALQHEVRDGDRDALAARPGILWSGEALREFDDVAAAMEAVDAVVGVDTALTHLAAALGRPTIVLLPERADWRCAIASRRSAERPHARRRAMPGEGRRPSGGAVETLGQRELHVLLDPLERLHASDAERAQPLDQLAHQHLRRRRAGGHADAPLADEPRGIELGGRPDQPRLLAHLLGHLAQPVAVRAARAADHQHEVALRRHELHRVLPVLRRVADVLLLGLGDRREAPLQGVDDDAAVVDRQRGLRHVGEPPRVGDRKPVDVLGGLDEVDAVVGLAHGAFDLGMPGVADHDHLPALAAHPGDLDVDLRHQRAGRVEHLQPARARLVADRPRHAVSGEHHDRAGRDLLERVDEDRALVAQVADHVVVVDDLVAHVDRRAELRERALDDLDRAVHARAEAARLREQPRMRTSNRIGWPASGWLKSSSAPASSTSLTTPA